MAKTPANKNENIKDGRFEEALWEGSFAGEGEILR